MRNRWFLLLFCGLFLNSFALSTSEEDPCGYSSYPTRVTGRHIEGKGIGYDHGYTTLEVFLSNLAPRSDAWFPFVDLRGHVFNNGYMATNMGVGIRYLLGSRIWGGNTYYDFRNTSYHSYHQIALGFESLGQIWDFRLNGYLPVGNRYYYSSPRFKGFKNHNLIISRKIHASMKGADFETGAHIQTFSNFPLYFAAGPYYIIGKGNAAWGGKFRASVEIYKHVTFEASTSYDRIFKWIGQGQLSFNFSFGSRRSINKEKHFSCLQTKGLRKRAAEPVGRREIIPIDKRDVHSKAINPLTGEPWVFWFVNNTSSSDGTFDSPFPQLLQAEAASSQYHVVYVFPGDGTSRGMNGGIDLKDYQKLLGAGIAHSIDTTLGPITIPPLADTLPKVDKPYNPPFSLTQVVKCANNNEIAGLDLTSHDITGILCDSIHNSYIHDNLISGSSDDPPYPDAQLGVLIRNCSGDIRVIDNYFTFLPYGSDGPSGIYIEGSNPFVNYIINRNTFDGTAMVPSGQSSTGITLGRTPNIGNPGLGDFNLLDINDNHFINVGNPLFRSIGGYGFIGTGTVNINNNTFTKCSAWIVGPNNFGQLTLGVNEGANVVVNIKNNLWQETIDLAVPAVGIKIKTIPARICLTLTDNTSDTTPGFWLDNTVGGDFVADIQNNSGSVTELGSIVHGTCQPLSLSN
ncbi:MAG: inverse autotransporter beta domain-containing protein [Chlamydiia bacterium]|nr:inverse autotransporter beta domain-containing protein [Chlamydiia bacterium]